MSLASSVELIPFLSRLCIWHMPVGFIVNVEQTQSRRTRAVSEVAWSETELPEPLQRTGMKVPNQPR
jgi:hypothetical protein